MIAKYTGTCVRCGSRFYPGSEVEPNLGGFVDAKCAPSEVVVRFVTPTKPDAQIPERKTSRFQEEKFKVSQRRAKHSRQRGRFS